MIFLTWLMIFLDRRQILEVENELKDCNIQSEVLFIGALLKSPDLLVNYSNFMRSKYDFSEPFTIVELADADFVAFLAESDEEPQPAKDNTKAIRQIIAEALKALYLS